MQTVSRTNAVRLMSFGKSKPEDRRARPGEPLAVGQVATLSYHTEHPRCLRDYVKVLVTAIDGKTYRGVVLDEILPVLIAPEKLSKGTMLAFTMQNVVEMADQKGPHGDGLELTA